MFNAAYLSIDEIHRLLREKQVTVREVVLSFLSRIAKIDKSADGLNSVSEINPDALFIADALDENLRNSEEMPPLFGIPILLKDNVNTRDRLHTTAGSVALADNYAPYDARIVSLLRRAGAVILGKVNMTEFANYMTREGMPAGYSSRGGQVINPYNRDKTPSGSSSGSAVAVAAGLCTASIGTETAGSIISPAGYNGIVGIKPTLGLAGRSGIIPISGTLDTAGPMALTVRDAAILLGVIAGSDPGDPATHAHNTSAPIDYTGYLDANGLKGARIGINRSQNPEMHKLPEKGKEEFDRLCQVITDAGGILVDNANMDSDESIAAIMRCEFKACVNYYLSTLKGSAKARTLKDIVEYNQANASKALKYGQSLLIDTENNTSGAMTEPEYIEALLERERAIQKLDSLFDGSQLDVMLCETYSNIAPFTGFPSMTIPIGQQKDDNMPLDSYWIARRFDEGRLLRVVYAAERILAIKPRPELPLL